MKFLSRSDPSRSASRLKDSLFYDLYREVKLAAPSAQLSYGLRCRLERCDRDYRQVLCSNIKDGCSPLFLACKRGNFEVIRNDIHKHAETRSLACQSFTQVFTCLSRSLNT